MEKTRLSFRQRVGSVEHCMVTAMVQEAEGKGAFSPETDNLAREVSATVYIGTLFFLSYTYVELTRPLPRHEGAVETVSASTCHTHT